MNRHSDCDTREHILATGEQLCMHRGFTGMGLSELLKTAEVPKGSFYHYFRSKEAFGVALLEHHYTGYLQRLVDHFDHGDGNYRDRLLAYYQHTLNQFCQQGLLAGVLLSSYPRRFAICRKICAPPWIAEPARLSPCWATRWRKDVRKAVSHLTARP